MMLKYAEMNHKIAECNLKILRSSHTDHAQIETAEKIVLMTKHVLNELNEERAMWTSETRGEMYSFRDGIASWK